MPTYDYKCPKCSIVEEHFHSMNDKPLIVCKTCTFVMMRMISKGSGVIFKGDGWTPKHFK